MTDATPRVIIVAGGFAGTNTAHALPHAGVRVTVIDRIATIAIAQRWNMDSRDQGEPPRTDVLSQHDDIWDCVVIGECSVVCPKNVDPSLAIQQYKLAATREWFNSFLRPWRKTPRLLNGDVG